MQTGELVKPGMDRILMALKLPLVDLPTYDGISRLRSKVRRDAEQFAGQIDGALELRLADL